MEFEKNRIIENQHRFNAYVESVNPQAKVVKDQLWDLGERQGLPPDTIQQNLPPEWQGKQYREIPYDALFDAYFKPILQLGKDEAFKKVEDKAKTQPLGTKSSGAAKDPDYKNMPFDELEKLVPSNL